MQKEEEDGEEQLPDKLQFLVNLAKAYEAEYEEDALGIQAGAFDDGEEVEQTGAPTLLKCVSTLIIMYSMKGLLTSNFLVIYLGWLAIKQNVH